MPNYGDDHLAIAVGLCYSDFYLYDPTNGVFEVLVPRMHVRSLVESDELALSGFPGETRALVETVGIFNLRHM